jgi:hypothetical protein
MIALAASWAAQAPYQTSAGGATRCPMEEACGLSFGAATPLLAEMLSFKVSALTPGEVAKGLTKHGLQLSPSFICDIAQRSGNWLLRKPRLGNWMRHRLKLSSRLRCRRSNSLIDVLSQSHRATGQGAERTRCATQRFSLSRRQDVVCRLCGRRITHRQRRDRSQV